MTLPETTAAVEITKFSGLFTNADESESDKGDSKEQINVSLFVPGQLNVRGGMRRLNFTDTQQG